VEKNLAAPASKKRPDYKEFFSKASTLAALGRGVPDEAELLRHRIARDAGQPLRRRAELLGVAREVAVIEQPHASAAGENGMR